MIARGLAYAFFWIVRKSLVSSFFIALVMKTVLLRILLWSLCY